MNTPIKIFLLFLLSMGVTLSTKAQSSGNNSHDTENLRIFGGINRSFLSGADRFSEQKAYYLPSAGISYTYLSNNTYGISIGLSYERKGTKNVPSLLEIVPESHVTYSNSFNYITLPVLGVYQKSVTEQINLRLKFGIYFSYLLKVKQDYPYQMPIDDIKYLKRLNYGVQAGPEALYSLKQSLSLSLQLIYNTGIRNIEDSDFFISPIRTNATQLTMGLGYKL